MVGSVIGGAAIGGSVLNVTGCFIVSDMEQVGVDEIVVDTGITCAGFDSRAISMSKGQSVDVIVVVVDDDNEVEEASTVNVGASGAVVGVVSDNVVIDSEFAIVEGIATE